MIRSLSRRAGAALAAAALLLAPAATAAQHDFGSSRPLAEILPSGTLGTLVLSGEPCGRAGAELALTRIWQEEEVQGFLRPALDMLNGFLAMGWWQAESATGLSRAALESLRHTRLTLAVTGLSRYGQDVLPDVALAWEFGPEQQEAVLQLLGVLESLAADHGVATFEDVDLAGVKLRRVIPSSEMMQHMHLSYVIRDRLVLVGFGEHTMAGLVQRLTGATRDSLAGHPAYSTCREWTYRPNTVFHAYLNVERLLQEVGGLMGELGEDAGELQRIKNLLPYQALAYGEDLDGPGIRDRAYLHAAGSGLLEAMAAKTPGNLHSHLVVPAETPVYWAGRFDFAGYYDYLTRLLTGVDPEAAAMIREFEAAFPQRLGLDLRHDLLAALGPEIALFASLPRRGLIPDLGLLVEVRDRDKALQLMNKLVAACGGGKTVQSLDYRGQPIYYVNLHDPSSGHELLREASLRPSWTLVDCFLLVTLWPNSAKNMIAHLAEERPTLGEDAAFAAALGGMTPPPHGAFYDQLCYLDLGRFSEFVLDNGIPALQVMAPQLPMVPLDFAAFPTSRAISQHLFGLGSTARGTGDGYYSEMYSPTGAVALLAPLIAGAALAARQAYAYQEASAIPIDEEF